MKGELEGKYHYDAGGLRIIYVVDTKERIISTDQIIDKLHVKVYMYTHKEV